MNDIIYKLLNMNIMLYTCNYLTNLESIILKLVFVVRTTAKIYFKNYVEIYIRYKIVTIYTR